MDLTRLKFSVANTPANRFLCRALGYRQTSGRGRGNRPWLTVMPFRELFFTDRYGSRLKIPTTQRGSP